jgi:hypothetical protein
VGGGLVSFVAGLVLRERVLGRGIYLICMVGEVLVVVVVVCV